MESPDLKPGGDEALETWLRHEAALPPLDDAGFSARVLAVLPPPPSQRNRQRTWICLAGAAMGLAVTAWPVLAAGNPLDRLPSLDEALLLALTQLADPAVGLALLTAGATLLYVFWRSLRQAAHF
jgi:hypothetical protein